LQKLPARLPKISETAHALSAVYFGIQPDVHDVEQETPEKKEAGEPPVAEPCSHRLPRVGETH